MAEPTKKSQSLNNALRAFFKVDREAVIKADVCIPAPMGCGGPAVDFKNEKCQREYSVSGFCQSCQDSIFGGE